MKIKIKYIFIVLFAFGITSCVTTKKYTAMQDQLERDLAAKNQQLEECNDNLNDYIKQLSQNKITLNLREEQIADLKEQRDKQLTQVGDLAVLSQSANENIKETLSQMEKKDRYIRFLQEARSKADSINLALAINLKSVLAKGIEDKDVEIKVDKTVVFINLSDSMLYKSGSFELTSRAHEVLEKIARIVKSRPEFEVMVEGYTDNDPISNSCIQDNWDLSVKRATSVVRVLQQDYDVDPNRLIAAGRGEYNTLASNDTEKGKSINRRTRIVILPKLNQFYDLLDPKIASKPKDVQ
ncbi:OmpA family protein [Maribellus comscasis]|uniref:OmpA family protein n=1 Tax=Maribellus comscasis TaxID=2681766 RepID=A0A6I6JX57_9BACT|nr:OmpA family protein [Maribellus comscasis]QGY47675.1 OmpA family protein [Maribellus comscasis]